MHSKLKHFYVSKRGSPIKRLSLVIFFSGIAYALGSSVWAVHIRSFLSSDANVGLVTSLLIAISFISFFLIIPLIESSNKYKLTLKVSLFIVVGFVSYALTKNFYLFLLIATLMAVMGAIRGSTLGLLIRSNSSKKSISKNEGYVFVFNNISFLIGPLIATLLLLALKVRNIFIVSALIILASIFMFKGSKINPGWKSKTIDSNFLKNFISFFKDKERVKAYILASGVSFWWSVTYIYMPLLIITKLPDYWIGIFLGAITIPLILFEYMFGKIAVKKGYKKLFFIGFIIPSIVALLCFFLFNNIYIIMALLCLASIGLAMSESNSEAYFFKISDDKEYQRFYSPFKTSVDTGHLVGQFIPSLILMVLAFKFIFLFFAFGMFLLALLALSIKEKSS